jgi:vacuolar-type H+-ATPase subunit H
MANYVTKADLREQEETVEKALREVKRAEAAVDQATAKGRARAKRALDKARKKAEEAANVLTLMRMFDHFRQSERRRAPKRATKGRHKT